MSPALQTTSWPAALEAARQGDLEPAHAAREADPAGPVADYLYGRALAEANFELDQAAELLRRSLAADPGNPLAPHALALALARRNAPGDHALAAELWRDHHLPHDLDLLGQTALTLEALLHPTPAPGNFVTLPWPAELDPPSEADAETRDNLTPVSASKPAPELGRFARRELTRILARCEEIMDRREPWRALQMAEAEIARGRSTAEAHLVAGVACEDAGLFERGRAHLARALQLEPTMLHARLMLGRAYLRLNWLDLATATFRSLPVEGPYDYYRHYHLALAHAAQGDRAGANLAMRVALTEFFFDTRHAFIERAWQRWRHGLAAS